MDQPWIVLPPGEPSPALLEAAGKTVVDSTTTAYICIGPQCSLPVTEPDQLASRIREARQVAIA